MMKIDAYVELRFTHESGASITLSEIIPLLEQIRLLGSIAAAATEVGLSYRHAWGRMRTMETLLGGALISKSRGRGSVLSELGEKLLWANRLSAERVQNVLSGLCREVSQELDKLLLAGGDTARIHASHGYAVDALVEALQARHTTVDLRYRDSVDAVASLARGECDLAGFHLPLGEFRAGFAGYVAQGYALCEPAARLRHADVARFVTAQKRRGPGSSTQPDQYRTDAFRDCRFRGQWHGGSGFWRRTGGTPFRPGVFAYR